MRKTLLKLFISLGIACGFVYWLINQGVEVFPALGDIRRQAGLGTVLLYTGLFALFHSLRAWRWVFLLRPFATVPLNTIMKAAFTGFAAIQLMPLRTGEVARPYLLARYAGVSKSAVFGTIAIERVIDGLLVSLWLSAALFTISSSDSPYVWGLRLIPPAIFTSALLLLLAFYRWPETIRRLLRRTLGLVSNRIADGVTGVLDRFHQGLGILPERKNLWAFIFASIAYWGTNAVAFHSLARGCGIDLSLLGAVAGMGCLAVGILLPAGPGYFGNFQVAVLIAVEMFVPSAGDRGQTAVFIFLLYLLQTGLTVVFGTTSGLALLRGPKAIPRAEAHGLGPIRH